MDRKELLQLMQQVRNHHAERRFDPTITEEERQRSEALFRKGSHNLSDYAGRLRQKGNTIN
ncbi:MAG: hypothetical protein JRD89_02015 [Deltaproteobacteria bacterium]|nr:hypothetical protein [Deltaproteobacteria bacterium]